MNARWAWQHAHETRHIPTDERFNPDIRISPRSGKPRNKPKDSISSRRSKPRFSLSDTIANLHSLLRTRSFGRWPLSLRFFSEDAYRVWQAWEQRFPEKIRSSISVSVDFVAPSEYRLDEAGNYRVPDAIKALDTGYLPLKPYLEKTRSSGNSGRSHSCAVCRGEIVHNDSRHLICPDCLARSHVICLANKFSTDQGDSILPIEGHCPKCRSVVKWDVMVREMSLRLHGQKEVDKLFREAKGRRADSEKKADGGAPEPGRDDGGEEDMGDDNLEDDWIFQTFDDNETNTAASESEGYSGQDESPQRQRSKAIANRRYSPIIEESGQDDVIVID